MQALLPRKLSPKKRLKNEIYGILNRAEDEKSTSHASVSFLLLFFFVCFLFCRPYLTTKIQEKIGTFVLAITIQSN